MTSSSMRSTAFITLTGLLAWSAYTAAAEPGAQGLLGRNLLSNGNAEAGSPAQIAIPGWKKEGAVQIAAYADYLNWADLPPDRDNQFFWGGRYAESSSLEQWFDPGPLSALIKEGKLLYTLSGWFGGFEAATDTVSLGVTFYMTIDGKDHSFGFDYIGRFGNLDRNNLTGLLADQRTGIMPKATSKVRVWLDFRHEYDSLVRPGSDAFADNLALVLSAFRADAPLSIHRAIEVRFQTERGQRYQLQAANAITEDAWFDVGQPFAGTGEVYNCFEGVGDGDAARFFRLLHLP